ncbi:MAG TPA: DUF962 domain-containing protein [Pyrinomonadaceae bacterium]|nr:DUF962 domain-containing protein [Pyrinomonadaceae bacterium]
MKKKYSNFTGFYPFYLSEHSDPKCRLLHFAGSLLVLLTVFYSVVTRQWLALLFVPLIGYGFAWVGHFFFEHNRPATFTYPLYSLMGDWVMFKDILTGKVKL